MSRESGHPVFRDSNENRDAGVYWITRRGPVIGLAGGKSRWRLMTVSVSLTPPARSEKCQWKTKLPLNPNIILGCAVAAFMACVRDPAWFNQQQFDLVFGIRLVFDAFRDDEHFARRHVDGAIAKVDPEHALQDNKRLVRIPVIVPNEIALQFDDLELVVVHFGYDLRLPLLVE
jgi:hypothetical protein